MKFRDLINEKWKAFGMFRGEIKDVFENPTRKELREVLKNSKNNTLRLGITDEKKPTIYVWDGDIMHFEVERKNSLENSSGDNIDLKFDFGFSYSTNPNQLWWDNVIGRSWKKLKNKKEMINVIKKLFPEIKKIDNGVYPIEL